VTQQAPGQFAPTGAAGIQFSSPLQWRKQVRHVGAIKPLPLHDERLDQIISSAGHSRAGTPRTSSSTRARTTRRRLSATPFPE